MNRKSKGFGFFIESTLKRGEKTTQKNTMQNMLPMTASYKYKQEYLQKLRLIFKVHFQPLLNYIR